MAQAEAAELKAGTRLLGYTVLGLLAQGGMAEVYLCRKAGGPVVVIKRIRPALLEDPQFTRMFLDEARLAQLLHHPNIVKVLEVGSDGANYALCMEFLDGRNLLRVARACYQRKAYVPYELMARIVADSLVGLDHAHHQKGPDGQPLNLVHRDMSPENIVVTYDGHVKVVDFGIAKAANMEGRTQVGVIKGKLGYVAPEAITGEKLDGRADVFAMGVTLYELLTYTVPFAGQNEVEVLTAITTRDPTPPRQLNPSVPEELEQICLKALEKNRANRWQSAADMRTALETFIRSTGKGTSPAHLSAFMEALFPKGSDKDRTRVAQLVSAPEPVELDPVPTHRGARPPDRAPAAPPRSPPPLPPSSLPGVDITDKGLPAVADADVERKVASFEVVTEETKRKWQGSGRPESPTESTEGLEFASSPFAPDQDHVPTVALSGPPAPRKADPGNIPTLAVEMTPEQMALLRAGKDPGLLQRPDEGEDPNLFDVGAGPTRVVGDEPTGDGHAPEVDEAPTHPGNKRPAPVLTDETEIGYRPPEHVAPPPAPAVPAPAAARKMTESITKLVGPPPVPPVSDPGLKPVVSGVHGRPESPADALEIPPLSEPGLGPSLNPEREPPPPQDTAPPPIPPEADLGTPLPAPTLPPPVARAPTTPLQAMMWGWLTAFLITVVAVGALYVTGNMGLLKEPPPEMKPAPQDAP